MGFFSRGTHEEHTDWVAEQAFVLDAEAPAEHAPSFGQGSQRSIGLLIDSGAGARHVTVHAKHDADKWLVPGMDVGVRVDPGDAGNVEIAWEELPSIEARVAAGDPTLLDPIGAEQKVAQARRLPPSDRAERLKAALAAAAAAPAPPGKLRAVAMVATIRGRSWMRGGEHATSYSNGSAAVLSINVPGRAPYAVFEPKFKCPNGKEAAVSQELPALVSASDPGEVEVLWAEVETDATFGAGLVADRLAGWTAEKAGQAGSLADAGGAVSEAIAGGSPNDAADTIAGLMASMTEALGGAAAGVTPPPGATPPPVFNADAIAQQRAASIKAALARTQDPAARKAMIDQFRAMGYEIDDDVTG